MRTQRDFRTLVLVQAISLTGLSNLTRFLPAGFAQFVDGRAAVTNRSW